MESKKELQTIPEEGKNQVTIQEALIEIVQRKDIDPERLEKFLDLQIKMEDRQSQQKFNEAMAGFQSKCPIITKKKKADFPSSSGGRVKYDFAPLDEIAYIIKPLLQEFGLAFSFNTVNKTDKISILHTKISHVHGHSEITQLEFDTIHDDKRMNSSQRRKSALSYIKRAGLENALGIVTQGEDDDALRAAQENINDEQLKKINDLLLSTDTGQEAFLAFLKVDDINDLSFNEAKRAINALKQKRGTQQCSK